MPVKKGNLKENDHAKIQKNFLYICDEVDAKDLVEGLFQENIFTIDDVEEIKALVARRERTKAMLYKLLQSGPYDAFDKFYSLVKEHYPHVAEKLDESLPPEAVQHSQWTWFDELSDEVKVQQISDADASRLSSSFGEGWKTIMLRLGLSNVTISQEQARSPRSDLLVITGLLIRWRQRMASAATLKALVEVLKESEDCCEINMDSLRATILSMGNSHVRVPQTTQV